MSWTNPSTRPSSEESKPVWLASAEQSGAELSEWLQMRPRPADAYKGRMAAASMTLRAAITPTEAMARATVDSRCARPWSAELATLRRLPARTGSRRAMSASSRISYSRSARRVRKTRRAAAASTGSLSSRGISRQRISRRCSTRPGSNPSNAAKLWISSRMVSISLYSNSRASICSSKRLQIWTISAILRESSPATTFQARRPRPLEWRRGSRE
jgi:hypothetical protein